MAVQQLTCIICNNQFSFPSKPGHRPNKCSDECRQEYYRRAAIESGKRRKPNPITPTMREPCEGCGQSGVKRCKGLCKVCSKASNYALQFVRSKIRKGIPVGPPCLTTLVKRIPLCQCKVCDRTYKPKKGDRTTACSRECGFVWAQLKASLKRGRGRVRHVVKRSRCKGCYRPFTKTGHSCYCSEDCREPAYEPVAETRCRMCSGVANTDPTGGGRSWYCDTCKPIATAAAEQSKRRMRKAAKARRDALIRGATRSERVDPYKVFDRDGWRCQSCNRKTPEAKRGSYCDNAPELDHIVPVSKGGAHTYLNTQCLCRSCNIKKSDGAGGQLRLFG